MSVARPATDVPPHFEGEPRPHRMTVDELIRHTDPDGDTYRTVETFQVGHGAERLDVEAVLGAT
jgi:hypothetical protein